MEASARHAKFRRNDEPPDSQVPLSMIAICSRGWQRRAVIDPIMWGNVGSTRNAIGARPRPCTGGWPANQHTWQWRHGLRRLERCPVAPSARVDVDRDNTVGPSSLKALIRHADLYDLCNLVRLVSVDRKSRLIYYSIVT